MTYRAAFIGETVFTGPEHSHLSDDELRAEALAECRRAGGIGDADAGWATESDFLAALKIIAR